MKGLIFSYFDAFLSPAFIKKRGLILLFMHLWRESLLLKTGFKAPIYLGFAYVGSTRWLPSALKLSFLFGVNVAGVDLMEVLEGFNRLFVGSYFLLFNNLSCCCVGIIIIRSADVRQLKALVTRLELGLGLNSRHVQRGLFTHQFLMLWVPSSSFEFGEQFHGGRAALDLAMLYGRHTVLRLLRWPKDVYQTVLLILRQVLGPR
jgi:hypothetical protein